MLLWTCFLRHSPHKPFAADAPDENIVKSWAIQTPSKPPHRKRHNAVDDVLDIRRLSGVLDDDRSCIKHPA